MSIVEIWVTWKKAEDMGATFDAPDIDPDLMRGTDNIAPTDYANGRNERATTYANVLVDEADLPKITTRVPDDDVPEKDKMLLQVIRAKRRNAFFVRSGAPIPAAAAATVHHKGPGGIILEPPQVDDDEWPSVPVKGGRVYYRPTRRGSLSTINEANVVAHDKAGEIDILCDDSSARVARAFAAIPDIATANAQRQRDIKDVLLQAVARAPEMLDTAQEILAIHTLPSAREKDGVDAELYDTAVSALQRKERVPQAEAARAIADELRERSEEQRAQPA